jgi:hypothetical protein
MVKGLKMMGDKARGGACGEENGSHVCHFQFNISFQEDN